MERWFVNRASTTIGFEASIKKNAVNLEASIAVVVIKFFFYEKAAKMESLKKLFVIVRFFFNLLLTLKEIFPWNSNSFIIEG